MTKKMKKDTETNEDSIEEVVYEEDQGGAQLKKLREKLKGCEEEKKSHLDGWQRLKADVANAKKEEVARLQKVKETERASFASDILTVLDSFDMAFQGEAWESVDPNWRIGVEYIHTQFLQVLSQHDITPVGVVGDAFDPLMHEAVSEEENDDEKKKGTIARVTRTGYALGKKTLRPAQVVLFA